MPSARAAWSLAALSAVCVALAIAVAGGATKAAAGSAEAPTFARMVRDGLDNGVANRRLARIAADWNGGPITTSTGETVTVYVSDSYSPDQVSPQTWAEFLAQLDHGPELSLLRAYIAPLAEIQQVCGKDTLGCYGGNELYAMGDPAPDGTTPEEVVRHEYGHHIAANRANPPWQAIDWGPKQWASVESVCSRVSQGSAFPGNERDHYDDNPGEAWAETYRILEERKAGITMSSWQIVSSSWYPSNAALAAAQRDVLQPWTAGTTATYTKSFTKKSKLHVWWIRLQTPLDGNIRITARLPKRGLETVALVDSNKKSVLKRATSVAARVRTIASTVCGQRTLYVRVTQTGAIGPVSVTASTP